MCVGIHVGCLFAVHLLGLLCEFGRRECGDKGEGGGCGERGGFMGKSKGEERGLKRGLLRVTEVEA